MNEMILASFINTFPAFFILLIISLGAYLLVKEFYSPAVIFPLTWSIALFIITFITPYYGFYSINTPTILIYIIGAGVFSFTAIIIHKTVVIKKTLPFSLTIKDIDFTRIILFFCSGVIVTTPFIYHSVITYGNTVSEIASNVRYERIHGEGSVVSGVIQNWFLLSFFLIFIIFAGYFSGRIKSKIPFLFIAVTLIEYLLLEGRSAIIMQIFSWIFLYSYINKKIKFKAILILIAGLILFIVSGSIILSKVKITDQSTLEQIVAYIRHIISYLYQGPILFSRYFDREIMVKENWDALNSLLYILQKVGFYSGDIIQHLEFRKFGEDPNDYGNVYSIYFSIYPHYGSFGIVFFLMLYSIISAIFFQLSRLGGVFSLYISGVLFSSCLLSVFLDGFGYQLYFFLKIFIFFLFVNVFFRKLKATNKK